MGRQSSDPTIVHSSIALLQERFRQLQRVKEMREEKELLRLFTPESERVAPNMPHEARMLFHPDLILPHSPPLQGSLPNHLNSQASHVDFQATETPLLNNPWPRDRAVMDTPKSFDDADVDTSLHL
uniref:Uncharacterized protein n=1 Tax=Nelumbo nucifera TaxID=4432 RepID=A0A822XPT0_NELNU|nr:TPA_asm: hypothetical protein HUJ06_025077 [Nelumbo nucifera]